MASRLKLHEELTAVLGTGNVYFQPPESVKMKYPCIIYARDNLAVKYADDEHYVSQLRYTVTVVDKDPDSTVAIKLFEHFQRCSFTRQYTADNLNHYVFNLYY